MKKSIISLLACASFALATLNGLSTSVKTENSSPILFINSGDMMEKSLEGQQLINTIKQEMQAFQIKMQEMEKELKSDAETFKKQESLMNAEKRIATMQALSEKEGKYKREGEGYQKDLESRFRGRQMVLGEKQMKIAIRVCKEKGGKSLLDVGVQGVYYVDDSLNITQDVLKAVDAEFTKEQASVKKDAPKGA